MSGSDRSTKNTDRILASPDVAPKADVLEHELGDRYAIYEMQTARLEPPELAVRPEWRYHRDGGAWLCKMTRRTKTVVWRSA